MKKILVIGAGELGSRHLQGLCRSQQPAEISVLEPNESSVQRARARVEEVNRDVRFEFNFFNKMADLGSSFDIVIVATNSDIRLTLVKEFLAQRSTHFLVLEKLLTNNLSELAEYKALVKMGMKIFVNCPRRQYPFYREIREQFGNSFQKLRIEGGQWGLMSNAIHFIDLIEFLKNSSVSELNLKGIKWFQSRRPGFYEATGIVEGRLTDGTFFEIICDEKPLPVFFQGLNDKLSVQAQESFGRYLVSSVEGLEQHPARGLYQSELTGMLVDDLLTKGDCELVNLGSSLHQHELFLKACLENWKLKENSTSSICPIT